MKSIKTTPTIPKRRIRGAIWRKDHGKNQGQQLQGSYTTKVGERVFQLLGIVGAGKFKGQLIKHDFDSPQAAMVEGWRRLASMKSTKSKKAAK